MSQIFGLFLALISSVFKSGKSLSTKVASQSTNDYITSLFTRLISAIVFLILIIVLNKFIIPSDNIFVLYLMINSVLFAIVTVLFTKSLRISDVSLVSPIMSLLPIFVTLPSYIILGEIPNLYAGFGIVLVTFGSYVLELNSESKTYIDPFKSLYHNKGVQIAFGGLIIASVIPSVDKIGIQMSNPIMWVFLTQLLSGMIIGLFYLFSNNDSFKLDFYNNYKILIIVGLFNALIWIFQSYAYTYTQVSYVQSVKRVSIILSILGGYYIFDEKNIKERLFGSVLILSGITLIFIFGSI